MTRGGFFETLIGIVVVVVAAAFLFYAYGAAGRSFGGSSYELQAVFGRVDGVSVGGEVKLAGIKIGSVTSTDLDPLTYEARLKLSIDEGVKLPDDSIAKVAAEGLLGSAHIAIEPGASEDMLEEGDQIVLTRGAVDFISLAVQAFTSQTAGGGSAGGSPAVDGLGDLPADADEE